MKQCFTWFGTVLVLLLGASCATVKVPAESAPSNDAVSRAYLSRIRVGREGNFRYWDENSPALKELKAFVAMVTDRLNTAANKIVGIWREIGRKPILSWGNSGGDYPMFHYTNLENPYPHVSFCLLCDDTIRERGNSGKAAKCKADCERNGWIPVSMRDEWKTIYGPGVVNVDK